jgi:hypothetical protein
MTDDALKPIADAVASALEVADATPEPTKPGRTRGGKAAAKPSPKAKRKPASVEPTKTARKRPVSGSIKRGRKRVIAEPKPDGGLDSGEPRSRGYSVETINEEFALVLMGSRTLVVKERATGPIADRKQIITPDAFVTWFGNQFTEVRTADGKVKSITFGRAWLNDPKRRSYEGVEFYPDPDNRPGTPGYLNLWRGFSVVAAFKANGYKTFRDHLLHIVCEGDEALFNWLFAFFAQIVQRPRERIGVPLVLRGKQGCGKTIVGEHFGSLFASAYLLVDDPRYVVGNFNNHMATCILLQADEAVWAGDKTAEGRLKGLVTSSVQQIEAKGVDSIPIKNYIRLIMTSNESWVVPAGREERRFAVLDVNPRCVGNYGYLAEIAAELDDGGREALLYDLLHFDLDSVDLRTIPKTRALLDQKERSLDSVPAWWLESGRITRHAQGWETPINREALYTDYIEATDRDLRTRAARARAEPAHDAAEDYGSPAGRPL